MIESLEHIPLQNRVDPWGRLHANAARGTLMGNRGILHNRERRVVKPWAHKAWIACVLTYGNVRRSVFSVGNYSELFFLDEATALAAGHRPCGQCQRDRYLRFKAYWAKLYAQTLPRLTVAEIDRQLHLERVAPDGEKQTYHAPLSELPVGTMFEQADQLYLCWKSGYLPWSFAGYGLAQPLDAKSLVQVLTPRTIVEIYRLGFEPSVHGRAEG